MSIGLIIKQEWSFGSREIKRRGGGSMPTIKIETFFFSQHVCFPVIQCTRDETMKKNLILDREKNFINLMNKKFFFFSRSLIDSVREFKR